MADLLTGNKTEHPLDKSNRAWAVALGADGARLAFGHQQGQVQVVDVASKRALAQIGGMTTRISDLALSEDGTALIVGSTGGAVQIHKLGPKPEKLGEGDEEGGGGGCGGWHRGGAGIGESRGGR